MFVRLSKKQREVILRMGRGERLHFTGGINSRCFFISGETISWATISVLEDLELIKRPEYKGQFTLTDKAKEMDYND